MATTTSDASQQDWPDYIIAIPGPPVSGKTTLASMIEGDTHNHSLDPNMYDYVHFNIFSNEVANALNYAPPPNALDVYITRVANALTDIVGAVRNPDITKQVVLFDGFPMGVDEAEDCRWRFSSTSSPDHQFPDLVVSLVCDKQTADNRFFARVPGLPVELYHFWERRFEDGWRSYEESTIPLINSYRERGIPVVEIETNGGPDDIEDEYNTMKAAIDEFLEPRETVE